MADEVNRLSAAAVPVEPEIEAAQELEAVFRAHYAQVFRAAYRVTGRVADAEDVLQTVFLRLLRRERGAEAVENIEAYLHRSAVNAALDLLRSRQNARSVPMDAPAAAELADPAPSPDRSHESGEIRAWLRDALARMNPKAAEMFALRYLEGWDNVEIARRLKTSQATVAVTLHRIRARMKKDFRSHMEKRHEAR